MRAQAPCFFFWTPVGPGLTLGTLRTAAAKVFGSGFGSCPDPQTPARGEGSAQRCLSTSMAGAEPGQPPATASGVGPAGVREGARWGLAGKSTARSPRAGPSLVIPERGCWRRDVKGSVTSAGVRQNTRGPSRHPGSVTTPRVRHIGQDPSRQNKTSRFQ